MSSKSFQNATTLNGVSITPTPVNNGNGQDNYGYIPINESFQCAPGDRVNGLLVYHRTGAGSKGIRQTLTGWFTHLEPSDSANPERFYVALQSNCTSVNGDGGTSGNAKGGYFGLNSYAKLNSTATYCENVTAGEFNTMCASGASVLYRSGIQIAGGGPVQGSIVDAGIVISNTTQEGPSTKWKFGILFGNYNGAYALGTDSTAIQINESTIAEGISFGSTVVTGNYISGINFNIQNGTTNLLGLNQILSIGKKDAANTPSVYLFSSGNGGPDVGIQSTGGSSTALQGSLNFSCGKVQFSIAAFSNYANDAAAAAGGVQIGGLYRNGSVVQIRVS